MKSNVEKLILKLNKMNEAVKPNSPEMQAAFYRIGLRVTTQAKLNIIKLGKVNTGRLLNSLRWEWYSKGDVSGIRIGSFGIPYAGIHEFGGPITRANLRAMFANRVGKAKASKGIMVFEKGSETGYWVKKPFLIPAFKDNRQFIINSLSQVLGLK
jgi:phage gpG-like protein